MLPLVFLPETPTLLVGRGAAFAKRLSVLRGAGLTALTTLEDMPQDSTLDGMRLVLGAGLTSADSETLAAMARRRGIPVNIEDIPHLCDFHVPAVVRRGDLLLTVSTGGAAPALSAAIRAWLEDAFGPAWAGRLEEVAALRGRLRAQGAPPAAVIAAVRAQLDAGNWLPDARDRAPTNC